jgi:type I restriction enzyme S subunit
MLAPKTVEHFSIDSTWLERSHGLRLDAGFYNPRLAQALETLHRSGMKLERLGSITERIFIPQRFARTYVGREHGVPFLQGSHIVHFQPADLKYVSPKVHKDINKWIIRKHWILVTRSGTVGRVAIAADAWDKWAASEHILRIVPKDEYPAGYLYAFLSSPLGQAQLTAQIYGAVVDELTEEQTRSVLVPVASNEREKQQIHHVNELAMLALKKREKASLLATEAVAQVETMVLQKQSTEIAVPDLPEFEKSPNFTQLILHVPGMR